MSKSYSSHTSTTVPLASTEQFPRYERAACDQPNHTTPHTTTQHRRHNSLSGRACAKSLAKSASITDIANKLEQYETITTKLPERTSPGEDLVICSRTNASPSAALDEVEPGDETRRRRLASSAALHHSSSESNATKDCLESSHMNNAAQSYDEPDHLQHRFSRTLSGIASSSVLSARHAQAHSLNSSGVDNGFSDLGCTSGISSVFSSPSASTVSSPLSSPTRFSPHLQTKQQQQSCCSQKSIEAVKNSCSFATSSNHLHDLHHHHHQQQQQQQKHQQQQQHQHQQHQQQQQQHQHNHQPHHQQQNQHHHQHHMPSHSSSANGSKAPKKFDPRLGPSPYRQLLPIALCILSFATVFSILIVYMDTTELRHQQFRLNMSRDDEYYGVAQDDPQLIAFLRVIHMRKYPMHFFKTHDGAVAAPTSATASASASLAATGAGPATGPGGGGSSGLLGVDQHFNFSAHPNELTPKMAYYVSTILQGKTNGAVIQSLTGSLGHLMTAPWLSETLNWAGLVIEPEPRRYFTLRKQNALRPRIQVVHACVSPNPYPKEVIIHNEESEVRINSLLDEETSWFNSRVKCFPLYTIMLASNRVEYDLLSLGVHGHELEILQTLPFEKIRIEIISIHLMENQEDVSSYVRQISKFLQGQSYKLQKKFGRNYFYQRLPTTTNSATTLRTRKKDILLLKTP